MGLEDDPFDWRTTGSDTVLVSRGGRHVVTVGGEAGRRLAARLVDASPELAQQLLARATGNYKRGNERR